MSEQAGNAAGVPTPMTARALGAGAQQHSLLWQGSTDLHAWDSALAAKGGHPLQSMLWGEARRQAEGIQYRCMLGTLSGEPVVMARVEERRVPLLGKLAWIPKGPVLDSAFAGAPDLPAQLAQAGYIAFASSPWRQVAQGTPGALRTIWVDLSGGMDPVTAGIDSKMKYGARRALREGIVVAQTRTADDVARFHDLCLEISGTKGFRLSAGKTLMQLLLELAPAGAPVCAHLFVARLGEELLAGAFILRSGSSIHYLWGATNREHAKLGAGEALHVAIMEWAVGQGCKRYDLEGIDPVGNPGTYHFKKKFGGEEVALAAQTLEPLGVAGRIFQLAWSARQRFGGRGA